MVLVETVDALGADARHQPLIRLADFELLVGAEVGLHEAGGALFAHSAGDPVAGGGIARHVDPLAAAFHEHRSAPYAQVAAERGARVDLLEKAEYGVELPPLQVVVDVCLQ